VVQAAALVLIATCGWLESAYAAEMHGLIPESDDGGE
jgi:hypothetical protein